MCLLPIAEALQHAHAAGVVHRDLKPENIMVREDGVVKLTDFGIAALLDPDEKFTVTGSILGSPAHLAPETIEGKPVDPRADLFSFGTILYWLSCGKLPYQASSPAALLRSILEGKREDPRALRPAIGDTQARIIAKCLENDPDRRYQSATEVKLELIQLLRDAGIDDPVRELAAFVLAPEAHGANVRARLVARSLATGEEHLAHKRTSAALAAFGRALALEPQNAQATGRVDRIRRRDRLLKISRAVVIALVGLAVLVAGGLELHRARQREAARAAAERTAQEEQTAREKAAAEQRVREKAEAEAAAKAAQPPLPLEKTVAPPPATAESPRKRPPAPPKPAEPLEVNLHTRYGADVTVDGRELGYQKSFSVKLLPGQHKVVVRHQCCEASTQLVNVTKNQPGQRYALEYGSAREARFVVVNAPADARVLVDGVVVGTAADPRPLAMSEPSKKATVIIGDRTLVETLKAGVVNRLDYAKATP